MSLSPPPPPSPAAVSGGGAGPSANYFTNLGLGYPIALALAFLVLLSVLLLASYICCRASSRRRRHRHSDSSPLPTSSVHDGVILPRIIFVAEDDENDNGDETDNDAAAVGLEQAVINSYPKFPYEREGGGGGCKGAAAVAVGMEKEKESTCSICLCDFKEAEMLRMMPECRHYFHLCCLDAWLRLNGSCPVCRNSPLPTPLSTPLQEVVPLSLYAADRRRRS